MFYFFLVQTRYPSPPSTETPTSSTNQHEGSGNRALSPTSYQGATRFGGPLVDDENDLILDASATNPYKRQKPSSSSSSSDANNCQATFISALYHSSTPPAPNVPTYTSASLATTNSSSVAQLQQLQNGGSLQQPLPYSSPHQASTAGPPLGCLSDYGAHSH